MPHLFRTLDGTPWKPGQTLPLTLADGTSVGGIWAGSAQEEKLDWWLRKPGSDLAQTEEVAEIAVRADDDSNEVAWGAAPAGARVFFVVEGLSQAKTGESYRLAKMVTTAATPAQVAYFRDERFSLFGTFKADGSIDRISPLQPPPPKPPAQGELF